MGEFYKGLLLLVFISYTSLASPLDDLNDKNAENKKDKVAIYKPLEINKKVEDNTFLVIHVDINKDDNYKTYKANPVIEGIEKGIDSYVNVLNNISD